MSTTDEIVEYARNSSAEAAAAHLGAPPVRQLTVVTCMDARIDLFELFGLKKGDAHLLRNAGGVVTPDTRRSLAISQRMLGSREIVLVHHTNCGMQTFTDPELKSRIEAETGVRPDWASEAFTDLDDDVRQSMRRIAADSAIPHNGPDAVRGFVFDVHSGELREVR
ncbi:beta-class carbonic anhydrase [Nocardiopsis coralliicola]